MTNNEIRVRFAPSPTGWLHIGNARTALFAYIFTKVQNGKYIIRIEDTDLERSSKESEIGVLQDLEWLGISWDEGPNIGGEFAPYRQSERLDVYKKYANHLIESNLAYYCFCTSEELDAKKKKAKSDGKSLHYDGKCRNLNDKQIKMNLEQGLKPVVRFKAPKKSYLIKDLLKDEVKFDENIVGDFIILRSNNMPTYNYAVVVDDALMKISHVIRGDDHLSNTLRQVMLFEAFEFELPNFIHLPMILGEDKSKMSKRSGEISVKKYKEMGYLPEALFNYLMLLGWSPKTQNEKLSKELIFSEFKLTDCNSSASIFDIAKLNWLNNLYLREHNINEIFQLLKPMLKQKNYVIQENTIIHNNLEVTKDNFLQLLGFIIERIDKLADVPKEIETFFRAEVNINLEDPQINEMLNLPTTKILYESIYNKFEEIEKLTSEIFFKKLKEIQKEDKIKGKNLFIPMRIALTGQLHGPDLPKIAEFLGKKICLQNIKKALLMLE